MPGVRRLMLPIPELKQNIYMTNRRRLTFTIIYQESEKLHGNSVAEAMQSRWTFNQSYHRFMCAQAIWQRDRLQINKRTETQTYYGLWWWWWWRRRRQHKVDDAVDDVIHTHGEHFIIQSLERTWWTASTRNDSMMILLLQFYWSFRARIHLSLNLPNRQRAKKKIAVCNKFRLAAGLYFMYEFLFIDAPICPHISVHPKQRHQQQWRHMENDTRYTVHSIRPPSHKTNEKLYLKPWGIDIYTDIDIAQISICDQYLTYFTLPYLYLHRIE